MERYLTDVRTSLRIFRRSPGLALSAVAALAMGIGFTTTMYSIVHGGTRGLPVANPDQVVLLTRVDDRDRDIGPGPFDYVAWSRGQRSFAALGAFESQGFNLGSDDQRPERRPGARVTPSTFDLLATRPVVGRPFLDADARPGAPAVTLLGYDLWRARFNGDSGIVGRTVRLNAVEHEVIGVMPPGFGFPVRASIWVPLAIAGEQLPTPYASGLRVVGRLRDGVTREQADAELRATAAALAREYPATHGSLSARAFPFVELETPPEIRRLLYLMLAIVSFVLLIACANVANLLLARAAGRSREMALRTALGASRRRIITLHLAESAGLAAVGGVLGVIISYAAVGAFDRATAGVIEAYWIDFRVDGAVLAFAAAAVTVAALAAGLVPALRASAPNIVEVLKDATGASGSLRMGRLARALVIAEVGLATGFLILTVTFTRTAIAIRGVDYPFEPRRMLTAQVGFPPGVLGDAAERARLFRDITARLDATPGVHRSAIVSTLPGRGAGSDAFTLDAAPTPGAPPTGHTGMALVTPGFFEVLGARVNRGRGLEWRDAAGAAAVAVVNESWVRRYSPEREPIGRRIWFGALELEIVGVAPDLQMQDPEDRRGDGVYASTLQVRPYVARILLSAGTEPLALVAAARNAVEAVQADFPLFEIATLYDAIYEDKQVLDAFGGLFLAFGVGALLLTMIGVYGVVSFAVARRAREIGVRVALGASRRDVTWLVLGQGGRMIGIGVAGGLLVAFGLSQALAATTDLLAPAPPGAYVAIAAALAGTAAAALLRPVRQALALQPMEALRRE